MAQGLAIILCSQIHNSFIFLIILSLGLFWRKIIKPHPGALGICLNDACLSLIPTWLVLNSHPEVLEMNRGKETFLYRNLRQGGEAIKGIMYWLRYPSLYLSSTIFKTRDFSNIFITNIWFAFKWLSAIISILFVAWANFRFFKQIEKANILKVLSSTAFIALIITSSISPVSFNYWHLYLIYPFAIIPVAYMISEKNLHQASFLRLVPISLFQSRLDPSGVKNIHGTLNSIKSISIESHKTKKT